MTVVVWLLIPDAGAFLIKVKVSPGVDTLPWMYSVVRTEALWIVNLLNPNCLLFKTLVMFKICNLPNSAKKAGVSMEHFDQMRELALLCVSMFPAIPLTM